MAQERYSMDIALVEAGQSAKDVKYPLCGLRSSDSSVRYRSRIICAGCCCFWLAASLLIFFFAILPAIISNIVSNSDLTVESVSITNPTATSFQSSVVQKFSNTGPISATAKLDTLYISWNQPGGGKMVALSNSGTIKVSSSPVTMSSTASVVNLTAFTDFNTASVSAQTSQWTIEGDADITAIVTTKVHLSKTVTLNGFDNFPVSPVINSLNTTGGSPTVLFNKISASMYSASNIQLALGQSLFFYLSSSGIRVGVGELPNYTMESGTSQVTAAINMTYSNTEEYNQLMKILGNYSSGVDSSVVMESFFTAVPIPWLAPALASMKMNTYVPGVTSSFVQNVTMTYKLNPLNGVPFTMTMYNPTDTVTVMNTMTGTIYYNTTAFSTVDLKDLNIVIPPKTTIVSQSLIAQPIVDPKATAAYVQLTTAGHGLLDVVSVIQMDLSAFPATIDYVQYDVPCTVVR